MKKRSDIELAAELTRSQLALVGLDDEVAARIAAQAVDLTLQPTRPGADDGTPRAPVISLADRRAKREGR